MKARDTVMTKDQLRERTGYVSPFILNLLALEEIALEQAEISFAKGNGQGITEGRKAGMKEVAEVIKNDAYFRDDLMDGDTMPNEPDRYLVQFSRDAWRAITKGIGGK